MQWYANVSNAKRNANGGAAHLGFFAIREKPEGHLNAPPPRRTTGQDQRGHVAYWPSHVAEVHYFVFADGGPFGRSVGSGGVA